MAAAASAAAAPAVPIATRSTPHAAATIYIVIPLSAVAVMVIRVIVAAVRMVLAVADMVVADAATGRAGAYRAGFTDATAEIHAPCRPKILPSLHRLGAA